MTARWRMPSDDEMRGWVIEAPDTYDDSDVSDEPMSAEQAAAHARRIEEARRRDKGAVSLLERIRRRGDIRRAARRWRAAATERARRRAQRQRDGCLILPSMTEQQIRDAGLRIDLPTEAASPDPKGIAYTDGTTLEERLDRRYEEWERAKKARGAPDEAESAEGDC